MKKDKKTQKQKDTNDKGKIKNTKKDKKTKKEGSFTLSRCFQHI